MATLLNSPNGYLISGLLLLALALFVLALQQGRQARRGSYWRARRNAGSRSGWFFVGSILLLAGGALLALLTGFAPQLMNELFPSPSPTLTITTLPIAPTPNIGATVNAILTDTALPQQRTQVALARRTPTPTLTPTASLTTTQTVTATATSTPTGTPTITLTPSPTFDLVLNLTPPASTLQPRPDAAVGITAAAAAVTADQQPIEPTSIFPLGIKRLYIFIGYLNMQNGLTWSRILYRDSVPVQGGTYTWRLGEAGQSFFFFGRADGYPEGEYEVRIFLGVAEISRLSFTIKNQR